MDVNGTAQQRLCEVCYIDDMWSGAENLEDVVDALGMALANAGYETQPNLRLQSTSAGYNRIEFSVSRPLGSETQTEEERGSPVHAHQTESSGPQTPTWNGDAREDVVPRNNAQNTNDQSRINEPEIATPGENEVDVTNLPKLSKLRDPKPTSTEVAGNSEFLENQGKSVGQVNTNLPFGAEGPYNGGVRHVDFGGRNSPLRRTFTAGVNVGENHARNEQAGEHNGGDTKQNRTPVKVQNKSFSESAPASEANQKSIQQNRIPAIRMTESRAPTRAADTYRNDGHYTMSTEPLKRESQIPPGRGAEGRHMESVDFNQSIGSSRVPINGRMNANESGQGRMDAVNFLAEASKIVKPMQNPLGKRHYRTLSPVDGGEKMNPPVRDKSVLPNYAESTKPLGASFVAEDRGVGAYSIPGANVHRANPVERNFHAHQTTRNVYPIHERMPNSERPHRGPALRTERIVDGTNFQRNQGGRIGESAHPMLFSQTRTAESKEPIQRDVNGTGTAMRFANSTASYPAFARVSVQQSGAQPTRSMDVGIQSNNPTSNRSLPQESYVRDNAAVRPEISAGRASNAQSLPTEYYGHRNPHHTWKPLNSITPDPRAAVQKARIFNIERQLPGVAKETNPGSSALAQDDRPQPLPPRKPNDDDDDDEVEIIGVTRPPVLQRSINRTGTAGAKELPTNARETLSRASMGQANTRNAQVGRRVVSTVHASAREITGKYSNVSKNGSSAKSQEIRGADTTKKLTEQHRRDGQGNASDAENNSILGGTGEVMLTIASGSEAELEDESDLDTAAEPRAQTTNQALEGRSEGLRRSARVQSKMAAASIATPQAATNVTRKPNTSRGNVPRSRRVST